jgi:acetoacetyl-CoA synthetase
MAVEAFDSNAKPVHGGSGDLVVTKPFPNQPLYFLEDPGNKRYRASYFEDFTNPVVWSQQDAIAVNPKTRGIVMLGRTDGTLNPNGIRFGSAEYVGGPLSCALHVLN